MNRFPIRNGDVNIAQTGKGQRSASPWSLAADTLAVITPNSANLEYDKVRVWLGYDLVISLLPNCFRRIL